MPVSEMKYELIPVLDFALELPPENKFTTFSMTLLLEASSNSLWISIQVSAEFSQNTPTELFTLEYTRETNQNTIALRVRSLRFHQVIPVSHYEGYSSVQGCGFLQFVLEHVQIV